MADEPKGSSSQIVERKLSTIVSADVAGYSRLMGEDEEQTLKTFRGHKKVFESLVAMHNGRIFNTAGDAILAEFTSVVSAVRCATDIQAALRTRNEQLEPSRQVKFRMGINLGDVLIQGDDLMGDGVNVAARLQTAAEPGGICISGSVHDQIVNKLSLSFQSLGEKSFKNIHLPVRTFSITETEERRALPSPKPGGPPSGAAKWIAGAVVAALLALGGGYWAYTIRERNNAAQPAPAIATVAQPAPEATTPSAPAPVAMPPAPTTKAAAPSGEPTAMKAAAPHETKPRVGVAKFDGTYSGQLCFGQTATEPLQCHKREGTIHGDKITGEWVEMVNKGVTMFLTGDITPSGDATILLHSQKEDGTGVSTSNLRGTVRDGMLAASGKSRRGRSVTIVWPKNSRAPAN
jgi:class 3 adenylate cyclase